MQFLVRRNRSLVLGSTSVSRPLERGRRIPKHQTRLLLFKHEREKDDALSQIIFFNLISKFIIL